MQFKNYLLKNSPLLFFGLLLLISSCGSYQNLEDNDGIYGTTDASPIQQGQVASISEPVNSNSNYYKNYFNENADEYDYITNNEVFTDVDEYGNEYSEYNDSTQINTERYAGWGQENSDVVINVYDTGWNAGWSWNMGFGWGYPYYGYGWGYPYYGYGWGYPGLGWCYPGYGWASPYYPNGFYGGFYGGYYRNNVAYVNGRRGSAYMGRSSRYAYNNSAIGRQNNMGRRNNPTRYSTGRPRNESTTTKPRTRTSRNSIRNFDGRPEGRPNGTTRSNTKPRTRTRTNTSTNSIRSTRSTRSYNNSSRPTRSFSSPSRSSGSSMGGGRSSGGRGGRGRI